MGRTLQYLSNVDDTRRIEGERTLTYVRTYVICTYAKCRQIIHGSSEPIEFLRTIK